LPHKWSFYQSNFAAMVRDVFCAAGAIQADVEFMLLAKRDIAIAQNRMLARLCCCKGPAYEVLCSPDTSTSV